MSPDDWVAIQNIGSGLAPILGILLACLIIAPPDFRSREQRRRDRELRRGWMPSQEEIAASDHWTCGRLRK